MTKQQEEIIDNQNNIIKQIFGDYKEDHTSSATAVEFNSQSIYNKMIDMIEYANNMSHDRILKGNG